MARLWQGRLALREPGFPSAKLARSLLHGALDNTSFGVRIDVSGGRFCSREERNGGGTAGGDWRGIGSSVLRHDDITCMRGEHRGSEFRHTRTAETSGRKRSSDRHSWRAEAAKGMRESATHARYRRIRRRRPLYAKPGVARFGRSLRWAKQVTLCDTARTSRQASSRLFCPFISPAAALDSLLLPHSPRPPLP